MTLEITQKQIVKQALPVYSLSKNWRDTEPEVNGLIETVQILRDPETERLSKICKELPEKEALKFKLENFRVVYPSCTTTDRQTPSLFSGIIAILLEFDPVRFQEIYLQSARDPRVLLRFSNPNKTRIHIWQQAERVPKVLEEYTRYFDLALAYLCRRYSLTEKELAMAKPSPTARFFLESDPEVYDNHYPELISLRKPTVSQVSSSKENEPSTNIGLNLQNTNEIEQETPGQASKEQSSLTELKMALQNEFWQAKEKVDFAEDKDGQPEQVVTPDRIVINLCTDSAALDLWVWKYNHKVNEWIIDGIYRNGIFALLEKQQFAKRYRPDGANTFLVKGTSVIEPVIDTRLRDSVKFYIQQDQSEITVRELTATYEIRLELFNRQQHLLINPKGLEGLATHERKMLRDTPTTCFIPYNNGIVEITATSINVRNYSILVDSSVWKSQVLGREFDPDANGNDCYYSLFISNIASREQDRIRAFRSAIGYLIHHYGNPSEGQAIICYDQEITDARKPEGGTGKGLFGKAVCQIRPAAVIDGKKFDSNDRFCFQEVNQDTAIVWIDDPVVNHPKAERRFSLERFFSTLTEGWSIEKKHEHAFRIPAKEGPKLLISSNVVMPNEGSSNVRRQFILEFSNHYKKQIRQGNEKPIQNEHGCNFFSEDWDEAEWQRFDRFMIGCVQEYLKDGLQPYKLRSADQNRLRQTAGEDFYEWVTMYEGDGLITGKKYSRDMLWHDYKAFVGLPDNAPATRGFTNHITQYAKSKGWKYERGTTQRTISFILSPL